MIVPLMLVTPSNIVVPPLPEFPARYLTVNEAPETGCPVSLSVFLMMSAESGIFSNVSVLFSPPLR
jgi:hypothetical protein